MKASMWGIYIFSKIQITILIIITDRELTSDSTSDSSAVNAVEVVSRRSELNVRLRLKDRVMLPSSPLASSVFNAVVARAVVAEAVGAAVGAVVEAAVWAVVEAAAIVAIVEVASLGERRFEIFQ